MPLGVFSNLGNVRNRLGHGGAHARVKLSSWAFDSVFYNWSLNGDIPDRLIVRPVDPWCGDVEAGARLFEGVFRVGRDETVREYALEGASWDAPDMPDIWAKHIHGFSWLRDLRAFANAGSSVQRDQAQNFARHMVMAWVDRYARWSDPAWRGDILGQRLAMWISHYEFFASSGDVDDEEFEDAFFDSLARQARHLSRLLSKDGYSGEGLSAFYVCKGLLYAGMALEGYEAWIEQALDGLQDGVAAQILPDGGHVSRNPMLILEALQILLDVRSALNAGGYPMPEALERSIDRMTLAVRFFRYNDKAFAVFHGGVKMDPAHIDAVLAQSGSKVRVLDSLLASGYERVQAGRSLLIFDCGASAQVDGAHAAPLAFELSHARERIFVNCGTDLYDADWSVSMRSAPAHNALVMDYSDPDAGRIDGRNREDSKEGTLVEASHDGYVAQNGMNHRRAIYMAADGRQVMGEETLSGALDPVKPIDVAVRFHLHPDVKVSLINEGCEALLRLKSGVGWRFKHHGGVLALEDSVYLAHGGAVRKTKQIVLHGQVSAAAAQIKWVLSKEG